MLLVIIHHAIILAVAVTAMSHLVWNAQTIREPGKIDDKSMQVHPQFSYTICIPRVRPRRRHILNGVFPAILTSLLGALGCLIFILVKEFQSHTWFNLLIDGAIVFVGVTSTHVFRYFDPNPFVVDSRRIHRQAYPSNLYVGLIFASVGGASSYYLQSGSNLAICLLALGCGHAGLLFMRPLPKQKESKSGASGLRPERT
jgi:hypothetical protein